MIMGTPLWLRIVLVISTSGLFAIGAPSRIPSGTFEWGDQAFKNRREKTSAFTALNAYREAFQAYPTDPNSGWRLAMACQFVGMRFVQEDKEKEQIFSEGRDAGIRALQEKEDCAACHFWTAVNMALYGQTVGPLKTLFTLQPIRKHLLRTIALEPGYAFGGAFRILGLIAWKLPGLFGGSDSDAKDFMMKSIEASPEEPMNYFFLAQLLKEAFHDNQSAIAIAKKGALITEPGFERIEAREAWRDLQEFVKANSPKEEKVAELKNHSNLSASMVSIFAAFLAGQTPNTTPVNNERKKAGPKIHKGARISKEGVNQETT